MDSIDHWNINVLAADLQPGVYQKYHPERIYHVAFIFKICCKHLEMIPKNGELRMPTEEDFISDRTMGKLWSVAECPMLKFWDIEEVLFDNSSKRGIFWQESSFSL